MNWRIKKIFIIAIFLFCFVGCDQSSKQIAKVHLASSSVVSCLGGFIKLIYVENSGGMLSFGSDLSDSFKYSILIIGVSIMLLLLLIYLLFKKENRLREFSLLLILSGGLGNLIDRIVNNGNVIDFIIIGFATFHTAVFNLADLFIMTGACLFIVSKSREGKIDSTG